MTGQGLRKHQKVAKVNKNKVIHEVPQNVVHRSLENLRNQMVSNQMVRVAKLKFGENVTPRLRTTGQRYLFLTVILFSKRKSIQVYTKCLYTFFSTKSEKNSETWKANCSKVVTLFVVTPDSCAVLLVSGMWWNPTHNISRCALLPPNFLSQVPNKTRCDD